MKNTDRIFLRTKDPEYTLDGAPIPAATSLLYRVCGNDEKKYEEACRIVELFIREALLFNDHQP